MHLNATIRSLFTALTVGLFLCTSPLEQAKADDLLKIRCDIFPPYSNEPNSEKEGVFIDIARAVFGKHNIRVDYQTMPWSRAIAEAEKGTVDIPAGAAKEDFPIGIFPEEPVGIYQGALLVRRGETIDYRGVSTFDSLRVGASLDYVFGDDGFGNSVSEYLKSHAGKNVVAVSGDNPLKTGFEMVRKGRIDAYIDDRSVLLYHLAKVVSHPEDFEVIAKVAIPQAMYLPFSPKNPHAKEYAALFDLELRELRRTGGLQKILSRYGLPDWIEHG